MAKIIGYLFALVFGVAFAATFMFGVNLWYAYVFSKIWQWFVVPMGLPLVGIWHIFGALLVASLFKAYFKDAKSGDQVGAAIATSQEKLESAIKEATAFLFAPGGVLLLGWIVKTWFLVV